MMLSAIYTSKSSMVLSKGDARQIGRSHRMGLSRHEYINKSALITKRVIDKISFDDVVDLHIYRSINKNHEVDTADLIERLRSFGQNLHIQKQYPEFPEKQFDLIIIPSLAVDRRGNRVGYGRGGYDQFLENQAGAKLITICFDGQVIDDQIAHEPHDIRMGTIITESRTIMID